MKVQKSISTAVWSLIKLSSKKKRLTLKACVGCGLQVVGGDTLAAPGHTDHVRVPGRAVGQRGARGMRGGRWRKSGGRWRGKTCT